MLTQGRSLASKFAPCLIGAATLLPSGCQTKVKEPLLVGPGTQQIIDLNADVLQSFAKLLESEEKLNLFMQSIDQLAEEDYQGLKSNLIKATQGNNITNLDDVQRVFADLRLNTSEFNEELLKNLVRFCKEIEARPVLREAYRDLDQAQRDSLQEIAKAYLQTKDGQKLVTELRKHGVNIQEQQEYKFMAYALWTLGIVGLTAGGLGLRSVYRNSLAKSSKHLNSAKDLAAIHAAVARKNK